MNYLQSMENIVESDFLSGSVAVDASEMLLEGLSLMQPVSLEKMDVEQVEVQSTGRKGGSDASMDEEEIKRIMDR
jgi:hypothetical protein